MVDFVKYERERVLAIPKANALIRIAEIQTQISALEKEISVIDSTSGNEKTDVRFSWLAWFAGTIIWGLALWMGLALSGDTNFIETILVLLSFLITYVGGAALVIAFIVLAVKGLASGALVSGLTTKKHKKEKMIKDLKHEISQLSKNAN